MIEKNKNEEGKIFVLAKFWRPKVGPLLEMYRIYICICCIPMPMPRLLNLPNNFLVRQCKLMSSKVFSLHFDFKEKSMMLV